MMPRQRNELITLVSGEQFYKDNGALDLKALLLGREPNVKWQLAFSQLIQLSYLEHDWDGDGARKPDPETIKGVVMWLRNLQNDNQPPPTRIVADPDAAIIIEWQDINDYLEYEFSGPYHAEWMRVQGNNPPEHGELNLRRLKPIRSHYNAPSNYTWSDERVVCFQ